MIRSILLGLGGTAYTASAIRHAVRLAREHGATITAATVLDVARLARVGAAPVGAIHAAMTLADRRIGVTRENLRAASENFVAAASREGVPHRLLEEEGDPFSVMTSLTHTHDLSLFGLRSVFEYGLVEEPRDALYRLLGHGTGPVLAVAKEYRPVEKVIVAHDGQPEARRAFLGMLELGLWKGARVRFVHCRVGRQRLEGTFDDVIELAHRRGHVADAVEIDGPSTRELIGHAGVWNADAMVLGYKKRGVLARRFVGSTVEDMIRLSDRSLLLIG